MEPEFSEYYQQELRFITRSFGDFAKQHPKVAARLGAQAGDVRDLYVERLLQASAFVNARSQIRIDRWPLAIPLRRLESVNPNFVAPQPSLGVARFYPDASAAHSPRGLVLPRGTALTMNAAAHGGARCEFRTAQQTTIWPLRIDSVKLTGIPGDIPALYRYVHDTEDVTCVRGALRIRLGTFNGTPIAALEALDRLPVYLCGDERLASMLFELIHTSVVGMVMAAPNEFDKGRLYGAKRPGVPHLRVDYEGLEPDESLLRPVSPKFHGQMLVHEFFALPSRFWFFALAGLAAGLKAIEGPEVEIIMLLGRDVSTPGQKVDASQFALFCAPVVNLSRVTTTRLDIDPDQAEHKLIPVMESGANHEVHSVDLVLGQVNEHADQIPFHPLDAALPDDTRAQPHYFSLRREAELIEDNVRRYETREPFVRTHTWLTLFGADRTRDRSGIHHLTLHAWLTNGDLPCALPRNGSSDLSTKDAKSVASVGFVRGPSAPRPPLAAGGRGDAAWELVRQLQLDLAVFDDAFNEPSPGEGLRLMLRPYLAAGDGVMARFIDGLVGASAEPVHDMHRLGGEVAPARGVAITLTFDESALDGWSPFTFALALERYVARHVSRHSFTRTTLRTRQRGVVFTWPTRDGSRGVL